MTAEPPGENRAAIERGPTLLPNLGAEEGEDWRALATQPRVRVAARLFAHLLSATAHIALPDPSRGTMTSWWPCDEAWPDALGPRPTGPVFDWLESGSPPHPVPWLVTPDLDRWSRETFGRGLAGPPPECVARLHDKAFAIRTARTLGLDPAGLAPLLRILAPEDLRSPDALVRRLDADLRGWPAWTGRRFTLKPRWGTSGRGRVGGRGTADTPGVRGAFARLAARGGAIFEPWLPRRNDLSVSLRIPPLEETGMQPVLLGSLETLVTPSGVFRGHLGEVDSRGRVFSGLRQDEALRSDAAAVARIAREQGFHGPCGIDAFCYLEGERERLRPLVEFNARATMGLITIGLVRRALPLVRERLGLEPGGRAGFVFAITETTGEPAAEADPPLTKELEASGSDALVLDLSSDPIPSPARPLLVFFGKGGRPSASLIESLRC
ncbi:MAG TPA: hypothetical protein ENI85_12800 [Deltaproteobacteria bacterium]|nr:hypothetical protein [Deltaproteobacteria bacterium]